MKVLEGKKAKRKRIDRREEGAKLKKENKGRMKVRRK